MGIALIIDIPHAFERHEHVLVVRTVVGRVLDLKLQQSYHIPGFPIDGNVFAHGIAAAKYLLGCIRSKDKNVAVFAEVALFEITTLRNIQLAHLVIWILHRLGLDGDDFVTILVSERIIPLRAHETNQRSFVADSLNIFILEVNALAGALAASLHAGLTLPNHDDVVSDAEKSIEHALT